MANEFLAIDVETANADISSVCQIGIAQYKDEKLAGEWKSLINPEDYFDDVNISIHGITKSDVKHSPTLPDVYDILYKTLNNNITVCHTHFDRVSTKRAFSKYGLREPLCRWLDSACVARRAWGNMFARSGYGLADVCDFLGFEFGHHDALEDAKAAGHIILSAIRETGIGLEGWFGRVRQPISQESKQWRHLPGREDGPLSGEVIVFTGALKIPRREAAELAAKVGCDVSDCVNKKTTILVVGDQDIQKLAGAEKSSKHRKVEKLILQGQRIRIFRESDFETIINLIE